MDAHIPHPTPEDYLRGVMPDGTRPPLISRRLYDLWHKPLPGAHDPQRDTLDKIARDADFQHLGNLDYACEFLREVIADGKAELARRRLEQPRPEGRGDYPESNVCSSSPGLPAGADSARGADKTPRVGPATRAISVLAAALRAAKLLPEISALRAAFIRGMLERAAIRDKRAEFIEDRAVAVVKQTLLALDDQFSDVGFGSWMPFRYPDQWLMFCGVMLRVLAANGLVHSKHADVYRRLLEETPPVEKPGPRTPDVGQVVTPQSWSRSERAREVQNLAALFARNKPP